MDQRTRKVMTMDKALHTSDDLDRMYVSRKGGGRGFAIIEFNVEASIQRLETQIKKKYRERLLNHQKRYIRHKCQENKHQKQHTSNISHVKTWTGQKTES